MKEMTAGEFGRSTGLSPKALRLYADSGLLLPQRIDEHNGYRYYGPEQLGRAERITMLRRAGAPLALVAQVVDADDEHQAADRLTAWWQGHARLHREQEGIVDFLLAELTAQQVAAADLVVRRRTMAERTVASITRRVLQPELVDCFTEADRAISEHLAAHDATRTAESWVIYHGTVSPDSDGPIEVCVPFDGLVPPTSDISVRVEPAGEELYVEIGSDLCGYPQILQAYSAVVRASLDLPSAGPVRERYISDWDGGPGVEHVADIVQPLAPAQEH